MPHVVHDLCRKRSAIEPRAHSDDYDPRPRALQCGTPVLHVRANRNTYII